MTKRRSSPESSNPPSPAADAPKWNEMVQNGTDFENSALSSRRSSPEPSNPPLACCRRPKMERNGNGTEFEKFRPSLPPLQQNGTEFEKLRPSLPSRSSPESSNPPSPAADAPKWNEMVQNGTEFENSGLSSRRLQALPIIAAAPTLAQAARSSGIGQGALYRWLQDNRFRHELTRLRPKAQPTSPAMNSGGLCSAVWICQRITRHLQE